MRSIEAKYSRWQGQVLKPRRSAAEPTHYYLFYHNASQEHIYRLIFLFLKHFKLGYILHTVNLILFRILF